MIGQIGDGHDVLIALTGKAHHKVELHAVPAGLEGRLGRTVQVLLGHVLVNDVAHALAAGLGRERQAALLLAGNRLGHIHAKRIQALRRLSLPSTSRMQEWSVVESEVSDTSS